LIPFTTTIPREERDLTLPEQLKDEWPGILAWMIDGCLEWQRIGLAPPKAVQAATAAYLESEDMFGTWLDECCERDANAWERSGQLFASWTAFAERSGEQRGDTQQFRERLERVGISYKRRGGKMMIDICSSMMMSCAGALIRRSAAIVSARHCARLKRLEEHSAPRVTPCDTSSGNRRSRARNVDSGRRCHHVSPSSSGERSLRP
jgi:phage/plasmid-associated DNA primase